MPTPKLDLVGSWQYAKPVDQYGQEVYDLVFREDSTFLLSHKLYGYMLDNTNDQLNQLTQFPGVAIVDGDSVDFVVDELIYTNFHQNLPPERHPYTTPIFDQCRFTIKGDSLILNYLSYPLHLPEPTEFYFLRVDPSLIISD